MGVKPEAIMAPRLVTTEYDAAVHHHDEDYSTCGSNDEADSNDIGSINTDPLSPSIANISPSSTSTSSSSLSTTSRRTTAQHVIKHNDFAADWHSLLLKKASVVNSSNDFESISTSISSPTAVDAFDDDYDQQRRQRRLALELSPQRRPIAFSTSVDRNTFRRSHSAEGMNRLDGTAPDGDDEFDVVEPIPLASSFDDYYDRSSSAMFPAWKDRHHHAVTASSMKHKSTSRATKERENGLRSSSIDNDDPKASISSHSKTKAKKRRWLISADHPYKITWDVLTLIISLANAYFTHTAIRDRKFGDTSLFTTICEIWYVFDILLNFITEYKSNQGFVLRDCQSVWARYLTSWFVIDILSLFPTENIYIKPIIDQQNRRNFFKKGFFKTRAVVRVTRILRGRHLRLFGRVAKQTKHAGVGASRLLVLIVKYVPKYLLFVRNMKAIGVMRVLRQAHWFGKVWKNFSLNNSDEISPPEEDDDNITSSETNNNIGSRTAAGVAGAFSRPRRAIEFVKRRASSFGDDFGDLHIR